MNRQHNLLERRHIIINDDSVPPAAWGVPPGVPPSRRKNGALQGRQCPKGNIIQHSAFSIQHSAFSITFFSKATSVFAMISASRTVFSCPNVTRRVPFATSTGRPMACSTWETSVERIQHSAFSIQHSAFSIKEGQHMGDFRERELQAAPVETQIPFKSSRCSNASPSRPGNDTLACPGSRFRQSPLNTACGMLSETIALNVFAISFNRFSDSRMLFIWYCNATAIPTIPATFSVYLREKWLKDRILILS